MNDAISVLLKISSKPEKNRLRIFFLFFLGSFCFSPSLAYTDESADIEEAVRLYKQGYDLFFQKRYPDALAAFLRSRQALPESKRYQRARNELLYYIGVCYMELGSDKKAKRYLDDYLRAKPRKRDKDDHVAKRLAILNQRLAPPPPPPRRPRPRPIQPPPPPPPPPTPPPHRAGWIVLGVGAGSLVAGLIAAILAQQKMEETNLRHEQQLKSGNRVAQEVALSFRETQSRATAANALFLAGAAITATGVLLLLFWKEPTPASPTSPSPSSSHMLLYAP